MSGGSFVSAVRCVGSGRRDGKGVRKEREGVRKDGRVRGREGAYEFNDK